MFRQTVFQKLENSIIYKRFAAHFEEVDYLFQTAGAKRAFTLPEGIPSGIVRLFDNIINLFVQTVHNPQVSIHNPHTKQAVE